jgi:3-methylfumaryl-CoA hydratase
VDRHLRQDGRECILERQTIVYRGQDDPMPPVQSVEREGQPGGATWTPTTVDLFRFSAVTFNAHRIHYDRPYATIAEGYPDLVVHGPLTATKLYVFAQSRLSAPIRTFQFRATAPLFVNQPATIQVSQEVERVDCVRCDGVVAMSALAKATGGEL